MAAALAFACHPAAALGQSVPAEAPPAAQAQAYRSGIDLVSLTVTVTDGSNRYVTDLDSGDFTVFEDGVRQDVGVFSRTSLSLSVALLLDSSASMEERMSVARTAALGFVASLRPQDEVQLIDFDSRVRVVAPFTTSRPDLERAVRSVEAGGSTALYTAIYVALREMAKTEARSVEAQRRQAIIVLSDGEDTTSLVSYDAVLDLARRSDTVIYAIGIDARSAGRGKGFNEAAFVLRELTAQTGGQAFFPERLDELPAIYAHISRELSSQYLLGYVSSNSRRDGEWRRVSVRVSRPGAAARTRSGYYAPAR
ncbi:MAG TPA: VWA domain-containing protein [Vicinamibacterales bacterium]|nr:VWA domain-containing protein [Vicinamibacterales bacterium]HPK71297.1 VWA domain-containing protein [Vicinamibacterales bacterium]